MKNNSNCPAGVRWIFVNWGALSCRNYICSAAFVCKAIGKLLGMIFIKLYEVDRMALENLIAIGHSLGGRIMSFACEYVRDTLPNNSKNGMVRLLVRKLNSSVKCTTFMFFSFDFNIL